MIHFNRRRFVARGVIFCAFFTFAAMACAGVYSGGSGTSTNPYKIGTVADWQELIATSADWDKHFDLVNDISFGGANLTPVGLGIPTFTGFFDGNGYVFRNAVFEWQSNPESGFFGTIDNGTIQNLTLDKIDSNGYYAGTLCVYNGGTIRNCHVMGSTSLYPYCGGGLCAENQGTIDHCSVWVGASGRDGGVVGGLCGLNRGMIQNSFATGWVGGGSWCQAGGLCGRNEQGTIIHCYAKGGVGSYDFPAGLCSYNSGTITQCYATGLVMDMVGGHYPNGLCAVNEGTISDCFWDVETTECPESAGGEGKTTAEMKTLGTFVDAGWDFVYSDGDAPVWKMPVNDYPKLFWEYRYSGGTGTAEDPYKISTVSDWQELAATSTDWGKYFILLNDIDFEGIHLTPIAPTLKNQYEYAGTPFTGKFDGNGHVLRNAVFELDSHYVGLFGALGNGSRIENLGMENIRIAALWHVGTLCGLNDGGSIIHCNATGTVSGVWSVGGLAGRNNGTILMSSANGSIYGSEGEVGGLVGHNEGSIAVCHASGSATGPYMSFSIGGLVGYNVGIITGCSATGSVIGSAGVGGLVGRNYSGPITACYATGSVSGSFGLGGLAGDNMEGTISSCYAIGSVTITKLADGYAGSAGGLVGMNSGMITTSYSAGTVIVAALVYAHNVGGLVGENYGTVTAGFWDQIRSGRSTSAGGIGKTTAEMKALATFTSAGWDFVGEAANGTEDVWRMCTDGIDYPRLAWEFSGGGDFACPDGVAMEDLLYLAGRWMANAPETVGAADVDGDGRVDLVDLAMVSANWMRE